MIYDFTSDDLGGWTHAKGAEDTKDGGGEMRKGDLTANHADHAKG